MPFVRRRCTIQQDRRLKRLFDFTLAAFGLLVCAPLWGVIALGIKASDGGPVLYAQQRVGFQGRWFTLWKFRSMVVDADTRFGPLQARPHDPRVTGIGRLLRSVALDELPQLWNILKGDMSFVGPRPLLPVEIEVVGPTILTPLDRIPGYESRHQVLPGLTGIAQVYAPRTVTRRQKFKFDRLYMNRQSFGLDLRLIALSCWLSLQGQCEGPWTKPATASRAQPSQRHRSRLRASLSFQPERGLVATSEYPDRKDCPKSSGGFRTGTYVQELISYSNDTRGR